MTTSITRSSVARRISKTTAGSGALEIAWIMAVAAAIVSCSSGKDFPPRPQDLSGQAVIGLTMLSQHWSVGNGVPPALPGYTGIPQDLNASTGGDYVWLYYTMGNADGSQGDLVSEIYTVDVTEGEGLKSADDTRFTVNTNNNSINTGNEIYIAFGRSDWPVVRGIAVAVLSNGGNAYYRYFPAGIEQRYPVVWVRERKDNDPYGQPDGPWGTDAQDLNEGTSTFLYVTDYIYLGYLVDQEVYDWLHR